MGTPKSPMKLPKENDTFSDRQSRYCVKKKLGEGACGTVFLVEVHKNGKPMELAAMKVEPRMKHKEEEILKMEVFALKKLQKSKNVCRLLGSGHNDNFTYMVMSRLGKELPDIRKKLNQRKMNHNNVLRIGIQLVRALKDIHEIGFVHRDVKPSNLAVGYNNPSVVYIFDFGLCRQILVDDPRGGKRLRDPRNKVMFRGTVRYCSINVHNYLEQGRHDDLTSALYSLVECATASLPWKMKQRKDAVKIKQTTSDEVLCKGCPHAFLEMATVVRKLSYKDVPPYSSLIQKMIQELGPKVKMTDPYEWTKMGSVRKEPRKGETPPLSVNEKAECDKEKAATDERTSNDVEDSVVTDDKGDDMRDSDFDQINWAKEDTLDGL